MTPLSLSARLGDYSRVLFRLLFFTYSQSRHFQLYICLIYVAYRVTCLLSFHYLQQFSFSSHSINYFIFYIMILGILTIVLNAHVSKASSKFITLACIVHDSNLYHRSVLGNMLDILSNVILRYAVGVLLTITALVLNESFLFVDNLPIKFPSSVSQKALSRIVSW